MNIAFLRNGLAVAAFVAGAAAPAVPVVSAFCYSPPNSTVIFCTENTHLNTPLSEGGCEVSVGDCDPGGECTVNVGYCATGGTCGVNVGYCNGDDLIGL